MPDPVPDRRVTVTHGDDPRDPIAVAFAALTAPEHQNQSGSRPRPPWITSAEGGRVDPIAVMRDALAADDEEQDIADEATRPGLFSRLTDRSRSAASRRGQGDTPSGEEPLVAPEVEAAAADSADPEATPDTSAADEGWVHHDGSDDAGHEGWLYHYADGTIVDADGTVYEYAAPTAAEPEPVAEAEPTPEPVAVDPEPVTMPTQDVRPEPEQHSQHEAEDEPEDDPAPADEHEAATEAEPAEVDPAPVAMLTDHDPQPEPQPEPEPEPEHTEVDPEPVTTLTPEPEHSDEAEPDATPEPDSAHEPDPEPDADDDHQEERESKAVPGFVEYSSGDAPRYVAGGVLLVASVVAVLVLVSAVADSSGSGLFVAALLALLAAGASWVLTRWEPTVVTVRDGRLEVTRGDDGDYFDLHDPATEIHLDGNPSSPTWRARFSEPEGSRATLRRTQVKARQFVDIVEHHRAHAADKAPVQAD